MPADVAMVTAKVQRILVDKMGSVQAGQNNSFAVRNGSALVNVDVSPWAENNSIVRIYSVTNRGIAASPGLYEYIALHANDYVFGHLAVFAMEDGSMGVVLAHNLLGEFLDPDELMFALAAIATTADQIDDDLRARFGGQRFFEEVAGGPQS